MSGTTDTNGTFRYEAGESVNFTLGRLDLGTVNGQAEVTVLDLVGVDMPPLTIEDFSEALWDFTINEPGPMNRATNIAMLLQSLDVDSDPGNGIVIPGGIAELIDETLDLNEWHESFRLGGSGRDARGLPGLLRAANNAGMLDPRPVVHPAKAMEHVYEGIGAEPSMWAHTRYTEDSDGDGLFNRINTSEYNASGLLERSDYDNDGDAVFDRTEQRIYNDNLQLTQVSNDFDGDGVIDQTRSYDYDEYGSLVLREETNGEGEVSLREVYEYDASGNLIRLARGVDNVDTEFYLLDENGDRTIIEYDNEGNDGIVDRRLTTTLPTPGARADRWIRAETDTDLDGDTEIVQERIYDDRGNLISFERRIGDVLQSAEYFEFNELGYETLRERDRNGDGVFDLIRRSTYTDNNYQLAYREFDFNLDGLFEQSETYSYNAEGQLSQRDISRDDGDSLFRTIYEYDEQGLLARQLYDEGIDGVVNTVISRTYNEYGRVASTQTDRGNDGTFERVTRSEDFVNIGLVQALN